MTTTDTSYRYAYSDPAYVAAMYARGLEDGRGPRVGTLSGELGEPLAPTNLAPEELVSAAAAWRKAINDHAESSYFGRAHIRGMRAYYLGRIRAWRGLEQPRLGPCAWCGVFGVDLDATGADGESVCDECRDAAAEEPTA